MPGSNIRILGILKEVSLVSNTGAKLVTSDWALDIIDVEEFDPDLNSIDFSEEDIEDFKNLSMRIGSAGLKTLVPSYAPEVAGYDIENKTNISEGVDRVIADLFDALQDTPLISSLDGESLEVCKGILKKMLIEQGQQMVIRDCDLAGILKALDRVDIEV